MRKEGLTRLINIALRGTTLASKFLLIFFLAKFLEPKELGLYGLLAATISYGIYLLGFDFHTYATREILKHQRSEWGGLIKDQCALSLMLYIITLPILSIIFIQGYLPWHFAGWFFLLLVLEHITQELGRTFIAMSHQLVASLILFLRSGIWAVAVTILMYFRNDTRQLNYVLGSWALGSGGAFLLGIYLLRKFNLGGWRARVNRQWIITGLKVAIPLLAATLAIRGVFTLDRYWLAELVSIEVLGAYILFIGMSNALISFLDAGVYAFIYPALISAHHNKDAHAFRRNLKSLLRQTLVLSIAFSIVSLIIIEPLLVWLNKPLYLENANLFPWALVITLLYSLSMVPHYALYAQGHDKPIIHSHIASLFVFIIATWILSHYWPLEAVPAGLCIAFAFILFWKCLAFIRLTPAQYR